MLGVIDMGTNFYLGEAHVGKRSSLGSGNGCKFTWAMDPVSFFESRHADVGEWCEVRDAIVECREFDYTLIGADFS